MQEKQILNVSQGIWLDEQWLHKAGLGPRVQVEMRNGEIRIHAASETTEEKKPSEEEWETFQTLGDNAVIGCLKNAAQNHDRYLYKKTIMKHLFVDTSGWDALADKADKDHAKALQFRNEIIGKCKLVTTNYILDELYIHCS